jgi:hypothetical protein
MRRRIFETLVVGALACAVPSLSLAVQPEVTGRMTGMSDLPDHVQDAITREAQRTNRDIRVLRVAPDGTYSAELSKGNRFEVLRIDRAGRIMERHDY